MGDVGVNRGLTTADVAAELAACKARSAELEAELRQQPDEEVRRRVVQLSSIVDSLGEGVAVTDAEGRLTVLNAEARRILPVDLLGTRPHDWARLAGILRGDGVTPFPAEELPLARALRGEWVDNVELCMRPDPGKEGVWIVVTARPLVDEHGDPQGGVALFRDVTQARKVEHSLRLSEIRLQAIVDNSPACIYVKDIHGRYVLINRAYRNIDGVTREQLMGRTDRDVFPEELARQFHGNDCQVLQTGRALQFEETGPQEDGIHTYLSVKFPLTDELGAPYAVCGISTDITNRIRMEADLRAEQQFLTRLLRSHERDRQLLAYEIHDGLSQDLAGALLHLESILAARPPDRTRERASFELALELLRSSVAESRRLLSGLRPPVLDEAGLVSAIRYLIAEHEESSAIEIEFEADVQFERLSPLLEGTLFRIVQESLTNVRRHSQAKRARVTLSQRDNRVTITVQDWGVGFDVSGASVGRLGLEGIRKRASIVGGQAEIVSRPGEGATVKVEFPLDGARE